MIKSFLEHQNIYLLIRIKLIGQKFSSLTKYPGDFIVSVFLLSILTGDFA